MQQPNNQSQHIGYQAPQYPTKPCKNCKKAIAQLAVICPFCGKKQKNAGVAKWVALGIGLFVILAAIGGNLKPNSSETSQNDKTQAAQMDEQQSAEDEKKDESVEEIKAKAKEFNYKEIMRNPDAYKGQYFYVDVKILTVEKGKLFSSYKKAYKAYTNDEYDLWLGDMIYLLDNRDEKSDGYIKILEDDIVKIYGRFDNLVETKNVLSGTKGEDMSLQILYVELISE